jgi:hypothetical protein
MDPDKIRKLLEKIEFCNSTRGHILQASEPVELLFCTDETIDIDGILTIEASLAACIREDVARYLADVMDNLQAQIAKEAAP